MSYLKLMFGFFNFRECVFLMAGEIIKVELAKF